mmetsp:Transcript_63686/g.205203  ORF Transcript_63686/g.205203 Transcript_63686/m.205203 type:complete len:305 (+) Transcript_63686:1248-2162(+)
MPTPGCSMATLVGGLICSSRARLDFLLGPAGTSSSGCATSARGLRSPPAPPSPSSASRPRPSPPWSSAKTSSSSSAWPLSALARAALRGGGRFGCSSAASCRARWPAHFILSTSSRASTTSGARSPPMRFTSSRTCSSPRRCLSAPPRPRRLRHSRMRARSSSSGARSAAAIGWPEKGSTGLCRSCASTTRRSQAWPEGRRTGSDMMPPRSSHLNSSGSLSSLKTSAAPSPAARAARSRWCRGTTTASLEWLPGRKRTATWILKSHCTPWRSCSPVPTCHLARAGRSCSRKSRRQPSIAAFGGQ